jgi:hypothetical protein
VADHIYDDMRPLANEFPELTGINPHYAPDAPSGVNTNCISRANATQQRLLGTDPNAVAVPSDGQYGAPNDLLPSAPFGFQTATTAAEVSKRMLESGNGSVGVLRIQQDGPIEHVVNVVHRNDKVYFIDSQSGHIVNIKPNVPVLLETP